VGGEAHEEPRAAVGLHGDEALRLLAKLKFRGALRLQTRRARRPAGMLFFALGLLLMGGWIYSLFAGAAGGLREQAEPVDERTALFVAQVALSGIVLLSVLGALQFRGLFLPREEIERLFSAPLSRAQLVRYRLTTTQSRSLFGAVLFGVVCAQRAGNGVYGFLGASVAMLTVPVLGQAAAILFGDAENRLARLAKRLPLRLFSILGGVALSLFALWLIFGPNESPFAPPDLPSLRDSTLVQALLAPSWPWARAMVARDFSAFAPSFAFALAFLWGARRATCALKVDFRELSLETSADVARRLNRMRKGGVANQAEAGRAPFGWTPPWLFGRGPFGAIARNELAAVLRKARGTLLLLVVAGALLALASRVLSKKLAAGAAAEAGVDALQEARLAAGGGVLLLLVLGTAYLCSSLRFDFRSRLHQMDQLKAWPVGGATIFLAVIAPETLLVWLLISAGILAPVLFAGALEGWHVAAVLFQPLLGLAWVAIDNAVFLRAPVRYTPGEDSAFLHMGRAMVLMLLRILFMGGALVAASLPAAILLHAMQLADFAPSVAWTAALFVGWFVLACACAGLVWLGGRSFDAFDVARDRG
jgi:hypothetical protein